MGGYFDRGASAGGHDDGYFERENVTGASGLGSATGGPGGVANDSDIELDVENPNIARAVSPNPAVAGDETGGVTTQERRTGSYPDIVEGSDSERTGTSWGVPGVQGGETVETPHGEVAEGEGEGQAHPNRNTGERMSGGVTRDELQDVGSWSTIDTSDNAGSPSGNS